LENVDTAYGELVEFLTFKYLYSYAKVAPPTLPQVGTVAVPAIPDGGGRSARSAPFEK